MRKILIALLTILVINSTFAQSPNFLKYQAVIRNSDGEIMSNQSISLDIDLLQGGANGTIVFTENHSLTTNNFGLINIEIGSKNQIGFSTIDWSEGPYFIEVKVNSISLGINQLLSVPYALYANKAQKAYNFDETDPLFSSSVSSKISSIDTAYWNNKSNFSGDYNHLINTPDLNFVEIETDPVFNSSVASKISSIDTVYWNNKSDFSGEFQDLINKPVIFTIEKLSEEEILLISPTLSQMVFNTTTNEMLYYNGTYWQIILENCWPEPTPSDAGVDRYYTNDSLSTILSANFPKKNHGTASWSLLSGEGGSFVDINDPNTVFTGNPCTEYQLKWEITTECGSSFSTITIGFLNLPTPSDAAENQSFTDETISIYLNANAPEENHGIGTWTIISGEGGSFEDIHNPNTLFTGVACSEYELQWEIATECEKSISTKTILFKNLPTNSEAGEDLFFTDATISTYLNANTPEENHGIGTWTIISGEGGSFEDIHNPNTLFTGVACSEYELQWEIATECEKSTSTIIVHFENSSTNANAGDDQLFTDGTSSCILNANAPLENQGIGKWTIISGGGGSFENINNPNTTFYGLKRIDYLLRWTIKTACDSTYDDVEITFIDDSPGEILTDINGNSYNTIWIGYQLWMANNLKVRTYNDGTPIYKSTNMAQWKSLTIGAYSWYDIDSARYENPYGKFYNEIAMMSNKLCPDGWHVPQDLEWQELIDYLGGSSVAGKKLKEAGTTHWASPNTTIDESGFNALPGGNRLDFMGTYDDSITILGVYWSINNNTKNTLVLQNDSGNATLFNFWTLGGSVRCVKD